MSVVKNQPSKKLFGFLINLTYADHWSWFFFLVILKLHFSKNTTTRTSYCANKCTSWKILLHLQTRLLKKYIWLLLWSILQFTTWIRNHRGFVVRYFHYKWLLTHSPTAGTCLIKQLLITRRKQLWDLHDSKGETMNLLLDQAKIPGLPVKLPTFYCNIY